MAQKTKKEEVILEGREREWDKERDREREKEEKGM